MSAEAVIFDFDAPRRDRRHERYTEDEIVAAVLAWHGEYGRLPSSTDWNPARKRILASKLIAKVRDHLLTARTFEKGSWPSVTTVRDVFGSMNAAFVAAGFEPRSVGREPKVAPEPLRLQANQIARSEIPTEGRFRHLVRHLLEAQTAGDLESQRALWYELAEVAVALGDMVPVEDSVAA